MEAFTTDKRELELLRNGPNSLASSWRLMALHNKWKKIMGLQDPPRPDCQGSYQDLEKRIEELEAEIAVLKAQQRS